MANTKKYVSLDKLSLYDDKIKKYLADADTATLDSAKEYAKNYADSLATNYDAAGSAATAESNANTYTDGKITEVNGVVAGVKTIAEQGVSDAATAQAAAEAAQGEVDALEAYVGTFTASEGVDTVVKYIDAKTAGIASESALTELAGRVTTAEGAIDAIEADYLKAADKTELNDAIALKADQTALDEVSAVANAAVKQSDYDTKVAALVAEDERIAGLVSAETERATGVEAGFEGRIAAMEAFFEGAAADEGEGENLKNALDTLKEIQDFATSEGEAASSMLESIAANAKAIEDEAAAARAAEGALSGRLDTLEAIDHAAYVAADTALENKLTAEINKKADAESVAASIEALQGVDNGLDQRIATLEAKHGNGEGTVESLIAAAKQEAIDTAAGDATSKANTAEANAKAEAERLNGLMNSRVEALEAIDHEHANKDLLDTYTQTEANLADAVAKKHAHTNLEVLEGITAAKVSAWDAAEANAKAEATRLDGLMNTRVTAIETWHSNFVEVSEEEINALFPTATV